MSNVLQYTLSLQDQISAKLNKIGITSDNALDKFAKLQIQSKKTGQLLKDMGGSVGSLREKLALLKNEKEWIPASNLTSIRKYNTEIKNLEKEIQKLDTINGSTFKRNLKGAIDNLPFAELITNPVAQAGAALFQSGKMAMNFDEGMAKINTTAQLNSAELNTLKGNLKRMGRDAGADLAAVPDAFEKILSQTGDVAVSQDILQTALKGSKAGFTDLDTVSAAAVQTLSLVGKENTNAQEVMDTLFAAKRVGAGEFKDFATYIPGLVASGQALGKSFQETAGVFAYMTGKGQSAADSTMLIQNAYTALGKSKITTGLEKAGVSVFNKDGSMKGMDQIFSSLEVKMKKFGKNDKAKLNFLQSIGLEDAQAKQAFMVLSSESSKLKESISAVKNSSGETDEAFKNAQNPMLKMQKIWSDIQFTALALGDVLGIVLVPVFAGLSVVVGAVADAIGWFSTKIQEGSPWILGLIGVIGILTLAYYKNAIAESVRETWAKRTIVMEKMKALWTAISTSAINLQTAAVWLLNAAWLIIPIAIIAVIALIGYLAYSVDGWGKAWNHTMNAASFIIAAFVEGVKLYFNIMVGAIMVALNFIRKGWYQFKEDMGIGDSSNNQKMIAKINADTEARKKAVIDGAKKIKDLGISAANEMLLAGGSLKSNGKSIGDFGNEIKKKLGIDDKGIKPAKKPGTADDVVQDDTIIQDDKTKTNDAIATGGTKHNYITIKIENLVGLKADNVSGGKDTAKQAGDGVADEMLRVLAMAGSATG